MTTTPTSGAADLPEALRLSNEDAAMLEQAASMLEAHAVELKAAGADSASAELPDALEALQLKSCPCGATPTALQITGDEQAKWAHVSGNCCGEWEIEYRNNYTKLASTEAMTLAAAAWNEAPRASHGQAPAQSEVVPECHYGPLRDADAEWGKQLSVYATLPRAADTQQAPAKAAPVDAIASILNEVMEIAVSNGANSVSMPDHYVEVAAWLSAAPATQPAAPQAAGKAVHQFRKQYCADWYGGRADHGDSGGPYEERTLYTVPQPAAQRDVQEDAARWYWLATYLVGPRTDLDDEIVASETVNDLRKLVDAARTA